MIGGWARVFILPGLGLVLAAGAVAQNSVVVMTTNQGAITLELENKRAPVSVSNFLQYIADEHYDGMIFHRIIENFVIQGGGYAPSGNEKVAFQKATRAPIRNDAAKSGLSNVRGTIAMARTSKPDTATAQFFINVVDNSQTLDPGGVDRHGYAVFGRVTKGMEVVDRISKLPRKTQELKMTQGFAVQHRDVPVEAVIIESVRVLSGPRRVSGRGNAIAGGDADTAENSSSRKVSTPPHRFTFLRTQADGSMLAEVDFGTAGTDQVATLEWSEDLDRWRPLPGTASFPVGSKGVHQFSIPSGRPRAFVRLVFAEK